MSSFLLFPQSPHSSSKVDFLPSLNFLFPFPAIDLINNLLQVKQRCRYTCDKSLIHPWLQVSLPNVMLYSVNTDNIRTSFVDISLFSVFHLIYIAYFNASLKICLFAQKHTLGNSSIQLSDLICFFTWCILYMLLAKCQLNMAEMLWDCLRCSTGTRQGGVDTMVSLYATETVIVHFQNAVVPLVWKRVNLRAKAWS